MNIKEQTKWVDASVELYEEIEAAYKKNRPESTTNDKEEFDRFVQEFIQLKNALQPSNSD